MNKYSNYSILSNLLDSIRYGESLSLLFKCTHKTPHPGDTLQMKHIYLSNDETMKDKYVRKLKDFHLEFLLLS